MKRPITITIGISAGLTALLLAGVYLDRALSKDDRRRFAARESNLLSVYDEILRYEHENLELPDDLSELAPEYLREAQLVSEGTPLYVYDKSARTVSLASGGTIRGLSKRTLPPVVMLLPAVATSLSATNVAWVADRAFSPTGPEGSPPPVGALVFEAEHYTELNYGWEVHPDAQCGGGAYAYSKEGIANGPGQIDNAIYNFYDVHEGTDYNRIRWHFHMEKAGTYYIYGRIQTTGSHCSNAIIVGIDGAGPRQGGHYYRGSKMTNILPFRWQWTASRRPAYISAGDHYLEAYLHEDGVLVDQFALSPVPIVGDSVYQSTVPVSKGSAFTQQDGAPIAIAFDLKSMVVTGAIKPECNLTIRRLRPAEGKATVTLRLQESEAENTGLDLGEYILDLAGNEELLFFPIDFSKLDISTLARREHLLVAEVTHARKLLARTHVTLVHPFRWEVCGPFPLIKNGFPGPLDGDAEPSSGDEKTGQWTPFKDSSFDLFGVLDFGLQSIGNSLHAPQSVTMYAQTEIDVPESKDYLLKIQSDDQMLLWIDGKQIYRLDSTAPVTRSAGRLTHRLEQGRHRIRMRVNQWEHTSYGDGRWQASLRIRTADDDLSKVTGI